jgi:hypothetical protein
LDTLAGLKVIKTFRQDLIALRVLRALQLSLESALAVSDNQHPVHLAEN